MGSKTAHFLRFTTAMAEQKTATFWKRNFIDICFRIMISSILRPISRKPSIKWTLITSLRPSRQMRSIPQAPVAWSWWTSVRQNESSLIIRWLDLFHKCRGQQGFCLTVQGKDDWCLQYRSQAAEQGWNGANFPGWGEFIQSLNQSAPEQKWAFLRDQRKGIQQVPETRKKRGLLQKFRPMESEAWRTVGKFFQPKLTPGVSHFRRHWKQGSERGRSEGSGGMRPGNPSP